MLYLIIPLRVTGWKLLRDGRLHTKSVPSTSDDVIDNTVHIYIYP